jgi:hypothetical protein
MGSSCIGARTAADFSMNFSKLFADQIPCVMSNLVIKETIENIFERHVVEQDFESSFEIQPPCISTP